MANTPHIPSPGNAGKTSGVKKPLPPLHPRATGGGLPPLPPRPASHAPTTELPKIARPAPPLPKPDLKTGETAQPMAPIPFPKDRKPRKAGRGVLLAAIVAVSAASGAVSARVFDNPATPSAEVGNTPTASANRPTDGDLLEGAIRGASSSVVEVRTAFGQGSGVIVQPEGLVVTNNHVVEGSNRVEIITAAGASIAADVLRTDRFQDLAVLRPVSNPGPGVDVAPDATGPPNIGETVFAIGSPFGLQNTVTAGIVSAFRDEGGRPLIQFDAPINPGNSGGGLFNLRGQLVGIPTSIQSPIPGNVGLGFAIPASRVRAMLDSVG